MESKFPEASRIVLRGLLDLARQQPELAHALQELHGWFGRELARALGPGAPLTPSATSAGLGEKPADEPGPSLGEKVVSMADERRVVRVVDYADDAARRERERIDLEHVAERAARKARAYAAAATMPPGTETVRAVRAQLGTFADELPAALDAILAGAATLPAELGFEGIAACYANVALAAEVVVRLRQSGQLDAVPPTQLLYLLAEAQSALLNALGGVEVYSDSDQHELFLWLKEQTTRHRIYVDRHMRLDDPADWRASEGLAARLRTFEAEFDRQRYVREEQRRLLSKLRFHCRKVCDHAEYTGYDWDVLVDVATEWTRGGHGSAGVLEALAPLRRQLPADIDLPEELERLLGADGETAGPPGGAPEERWHARVDLLERATELLAGRTVTLFGRRERAPSKSALEQAFRLAELRWVEIGSEEIEARLASEIARADVNMVLIAMRLPAPSYELFKELCIEHNKPFVRLPNGYGPGQVAQQVLRQVGRRLKPLEAELTAERPS